MLPVSRSWSCMHPMMTCVLLLSIILMPMTCRKHHLDLRNDYRRLFKVSTFGYTTGGTLDMSVREFSSAEFNPKDRFGFTITQTLSDSLSPYREAHDRRCYLTRPLPEYEDDGTGLITMIMDLEKEVVTLSCNQHLSHLLISDTASLDSGGDRMKRAAVVGNVTSPITLIAAAGNGSAAESPVIKPAPAIPGEAAVPAAPAAAPQPVDEKPDSEPDDNDTSDRRENPPRAGAVPDAKADPDAKGEPIDNEDDTGAGAGQPAAAALPSSSSSISSCKSLSSLKLHKKSTEEGRLLFSFSFKFLITNPDEVGLYTVYFHSCPNYDKLNEPVFTLTHSNLSLQITEKNRDSYLSAGEIPLPELFFLLCTLFTIMGCVWIQVLLSRRRDTFKIHYLMGLLVFVKASALLFHGINYHFISVTGSETHTWAVLYYTTHLLKGALLFITIVLIGTGWAFVKHILSDRDKQLFMVVIPLQVLANIAEIMTEESEEGAVYHNKWREIFILVDLLCCGAILFPVVWSIKHLQEAAHVDGKAATNLQKLKLFRRFYVIVVCYIYFTRIIVYLVKITLPFQYEWMDVLCQHVAIGVFFGLTAYHFQPTPQNPYFRVSMDDDLEMEEVLFEVTPNTYTQSLSKKSKNRDITLMVDAEDDDYTDARDDGSKRLISKRESSHDFD